MGFAHLHFKPHSEIFPYPRCFHGFHHVSFFMSKNDVFAHILKVGQSARQANTPLLLHLGCCSKLSASSGCWANQCNLFTNNGHRPALHHQVWIPFHIRNQVRCMARLYQSGSCTLCRLRHLPYSLFRRGHF